MKPLVDSINFTTPDDINDCWVVTGKTVKNGYLPICRSINGAATTFYAHRVVFELVYGPIPPGMQVMHICDNPSCVNPDHLTVGTSRQNSHDCARKGRNCAKLTREQATEIITSPVLTRQRAVEIAAAAGVTVNTVLTTRNSEQTWPWLRKELGLPYHYRKKPKTYTPKNRWNRLVMSYRAKLRNGLESQITDEERDEMNRYNQERWDATTQRYRTDQEYAERRRQKAAQRRERIRQQDPQRHALYNAQQAERQRNASPEVKAARRKASWERHKERYHTDPVFAQACRDRVKQLRKQNPEKYRQQDRARYERRKQNPNAVEASKQANARWRAKQKEQPSE